MTNLSISVDKWYSWIPTNIGYLNFNYVADIDHLDYVFGKDEYILKNISQQHKNITISKTYLSDLNCNLGKVFDIEELYPICEIDINLNIKKNQELNVSKPDNFIGTIKLIYKKDDTELLVVNSTFMIELNGKLELGSVSLSYNSDLAIIEIQDETAIIQTSLTGLFTLLKKVVHGDHHHHQKVDTLIGIHKEFIPKQILTDLSFQIKRMEKFCKNKKVISNPIHQNYILNLPNQADGFMSYVDTFKVLFQDDLESATKEKYVKKESIENVVDSIKASVSKIKLQNEQNLRIKTISLTLMAIFISLNIMFSNYIGNGTENIILSTAKFLANAHENMVLVFSALFTLGIFIFTLENMLYSYFAYKLRDNKLYNLYELFIFKVNTSHLIDVKSGIKNIDIFHNHYTKRYIYLLVSIEILTVLIGLGILFF